MNKNNKFQMMEIQGNNGGDYFKIIKEEDNQAIIEVGHCCLITVRKRIPIELLTVLLTQLEDSNTFEKIIDESSWEEAYKEKLKKQIATLSIFGEVIK